MMPSMAIGRMRRRREDAISTLRLPVRLPLAVDAVTGSAAILVECFAGNDFNAFSDTASWHAARIKQQC